jgi:hypothetical protein
MQESGESLACEEIAALPFVGPHLCLPFPFQGLGRTFGGKVQAWQALAMTTGARGSFRWAKPGHCCA